MDSREIPLILNSSTASGAKNKSAGGDRFSIQLDPALIVPRDAKTCYLMVELANIWWTVPNVITGENDAFSIDDGGGPYTFTIAQGLYDVPTLNSTINTGIVNAGGPANLITLIPDSATNKIVMAVNAAGVTVYTTIANSVLVSLCGFSAAADLGPTVAALEYFLAPDVANFNTVNSFLLHSNLVDNGIRVNNTYSQTIAQIPINVRPGSLNTYEPINPRKIDASTLIGARTSIINVWLTDENNNPVNTGGEDYDAGVTIVYTL